MKIIKNDIKNSAILIVEDDFVGRAVLKEIFRKQGFNNIGEAENGKEALSKLETFRPDLVILDVIMPELDGIECCRQIRANPDSRLASVPVLFQTALDGSSEKSSLFAAGATDYLSKPIDPNELTARALVHLDREVILRRLTDYQKRIAQELDIARATQKVLIPEEKLIKNVERDYKLKIRGHYEACSELGGDFWGFKSLSNDELAIYMVDFSGHGVNAALNVFRMHALMQAAMNTAYVPSAYLTHLNAHLAPLLPPGQFATMFYGIINSRKNTLSYASAASPEPVLFRKNGESVSLLESTGTVLGALKESTYKMLEIPFNPGDCLLLYSDALTETFDDNGNMFPIEKWLDIFQSRLKENPDSGDIALTEMLQDFRARCSANLLDDLTLSAYFRN